VERRVESDNSCLEGQAARQIQRRPRDIGDLVTGHR
jgi:hypothetical protein